MFSADGAPYNCVQRVASQCEERGLSCRRVPAKTVFWPGLKLAGQLIMLISPSGVGVVHPDTIRIDRELACHSDPGLLVDSDALGKRTMLRTGRVRQAIFAH